MKTALLGLCACLALSGCIWPRHNNAARLMARPDWPQARTAAPQWCRDALKTVNSLEYELEK